MRCPGGRTFQIPQGIFWFLDKYTKISYHYHRIMTPEKGKFIFFWTLVAVFFVFSALIIFYAFGYRYSFGKGVFIYGGSVSLKTLPQTVDVAINGVPIPSKKLNRLNNSYHIDGIKPGEYVITVSADGFKPWSKRVDVHSGLSAEFWNVMLVRNSYDRISYDATQSGKIFISPKNDLLAFTQKKDEEFLVGLLDSEEQIAKNIFSSKEYVFTNDEKENIEWSPQAHRLIIPTIKNDGTKHYFIETTETGETIDLKDIVNTNNISHVRWDPDTKNALFYMDGDTLYRVDLDNPQSITTLVSGIASYDLSSSGLYYMQLPGGIIYRTNMTGSSNPEQITTSGPAEMSDTSYQIIVYDKDRITYLNRSGDFYVYNKGELDTYFRKMPGKIRGAQFSNDGKKILFWSDNEILAYFSRKWEVQPTRMENELATVTRFSEPVVDVQWTKDYEHIIFATGKKIKVIELDPRDHRTMEDVLDISADSTHLVSNHSDGNLYFTDKNSAGIVTIQSITFPEKTGILGF